MVNRILSRGIGLRSSKAVESSIHPKFGALLTFSCARLLHGFQFPVLTACDVLQQAEFTRMQRIRLPQRYPFSRTRSRPTPSDRTVLVGLHVDP